MGKEIPLGTVYKLSSGKRQYPVEFYLSPDGFKYGDKEVLCRSCGSSPATYQLAISNHLYEPQGSEYYCRTCVPKPQDTSTA